MKQSEVHTRITLEDDKGIRLQISQIRVRRIEVDRQFNSELEALKKRLDLLTKSR